MSKYEVLSAMGHKDRIIRAIGDTVGLLTAPEDVEAAQNGDTGGATWGRLSLVSFQADGTLAALDHVQSRLVQVYGIVVLKDSRALGSPRLTGAL